MVMTTMSAYINFDGRAREGSAPEWGNRRALVLSGPDRSLLQHWWDGLAAGATIDQPLTVAPWGDLNGSLVERFGIRWIVNMGASDQAPPPRVFDQETTQMWFSTVCTTPWRTTSV